MGDLAMAQDDTEVIGDPAPIGLGADAPVADAPVEHPDELSELLRQFEEGVNQQTQQVDQVDQGRLERERATAAHLTAITEGLQIDSRRQELQEAEQQLLLSLHQRDLADAVQSVRSDLDKNLFSDGFIQTWLDAKANSDQRLQQLWLERGQNPGAMKAALNQLAAEFHQTFGKVSRVDENSTVDHEAVAQAVRNSGGKIPPEPPPDYSRMSNREFQKYTQDNWGF
jgi:folylpolyglutamate synthase/dihydropteroate synthase